MKYFVDLDALHRTLTKAYEIGEGEPGRKSFAEGCERVLELTQEQALLFSNTVLSKNSSRSADFVSINASKIIGTWIRMEQQGMVSALLITKTETWNFRDDLVYEHKFEKYEGYTTPFGFSYSNPSSNIEKGIWAPGDLPDDDIRIVVLSPEGGAHILRLTWLDKDVYFHKTCLINNERFTRS
jgi:hypothetical protein